MHLSLIRLLRKKLNELPRTTQFTELYELANVALDLVLAQNKLNKMHHECVEQMWKENRKLYFDNMALGNYIKTNIKTEDSVPVQVAEAMRRVAMQDYHAAYGIPLELPPENEE